MENLETKAEEGEPPDGADDFVKPRAYFDAEVSYTNKDYTAE